MVRPHALNAVKTGACAYIAALIIGSWLGGSLTTVVAAPAWLEILCATVLGCLTLRAAAKRPSQAGSMRPGAAVAILATLAGLALPVSALSGPVAIAKLPANLLRWSHHDPDADSSIFSALDMLDTRPNALLGRRIAVIGNWKPATKEERPAVFRRIMACCAADAINVGFEVEPMHPVALRLGSVVQVSGIVRALLRDGEVRYVLERATVSNLNGENNAAK